MHSPSREEPRSCEELSELLSLADPQALVEVANQCLAEATLTGATLTVVRGPEVGTVATQVREPIAGTRFLLADVLVSSAEVTLDGTPGWAMRLGADRPAALAQAICAAELARNGRLAEHLQRLCSDIATTRDLDRAAEWERLAPTVVEFEEVL